MIPRTPRPHRIVPGAKRGSGEPRAEARMQRRRIPPYTPCRPARRCARARGEADRGEDPMPDMFAHYLVAEAAAQRAGAGRLLADAFDAYKVGAQGPDVFFYSRLVRGRRGRPNLAHLTHQHQMAAAFRSMLARAAALPAEERGAAFAFVAGYAAHLCLDAEAHPWVLYWTGDITDGADPAAKSRSLPPARDPRGVHRRHPHPRAVRRHRLAAPAAAPAPAAGAGDDGGDAAERHAERRVRRDVHPRGGALGLPRDGVGLHDDDRSARPADAASRDGRPRGRQGRRRAHPDLPGGPGARRRPPLRRAEPLVPPLAAGEPCTATFAEILETATAETARCLRAIAAVADRDAAVDEAVAVIGDRSMFTGLACDDARPLVAFAPRPGAALGRRLTAALSASSWTARSGTRRCSWSRGSS